MGETVKPYLLSSLLINELDQAVTQEKIQIIFKHLGLEFNPKIAQICCLKKEEIEKFYTAVTAAPVVAAPVAAGAGTADKKEEAKKAEPEPADDVDLFGDDDLFG